MSENLKWGWMIRGCEVIQSYFISQNMFKFNDRNCRLLSDAISWKTMKIDPSSAIIHSQVVNDTASCMSIHWFSTNMRKLYLSHSSALGYAGRSHKPIHICSGILTAVIYTWRIIVGSFIPLSTSSQKQNYTPPLACYQCSDTLSPFVLFLHFLWLNYPLIPFWCSIDLWTTHNICDGTAPILSQTSV